ncbi:hypothetical protein ACQW02_20435 [Humitalea sp. 24SJ18S-53]|uniref:hypothetical protein n=1 Tax=Humitalea sp. 24SJ18S-53 TaxID=3422307 RepID=UPI003D67ACC8
MALWAFRGLPLGPGLLWLSPLPLFLAGLGFGLPAMVAAVGVASAALLAAGGFIPFAIHFLAFALPAVILVAVGLRRGRLDGSLPLALLGIYPAVLILFAALLLAGDGGLEAVLTAIVKVGLDRMGLPAGDAMVADIVRIKAAAVGFWLALALLVNGIGAQGFLARRGLSLAPRPAWSEAMLPKLYPAIPAVALVIAAMDDFGGTTLSLFIVLMLPLLFRGLAVIHTRTRGRNGRPFILGAGYMALVIFSVPTAAFLVGLALFDHFSARAPRGTT